MLFALLAFALGQAAAPSTTAAPDTGEAGNTAALEAAAQSLHAGRPQEALDTVGPVIAAYERQQAGETRQVYCGMSPVETLLYMGMAAKAKHDAIAVSPSYCTALYFRGYALIDLGHPAEARAVYERVIALAPMHAHFLAEMGQTYRPEKNWAAMLDWCTKANGAVALAPAGEKAREQGFAWHCMGYALTEQGKLDEAEKLYRDCLALDPRDEHAQHELSYITEQRAKAKP